MPIYTTSAKVLLELPADPPAKVTDFTADDIASASQMVEASVGTDYGFNYANSSQRFPDIDDDPATPDIIELLARWYAANLQWMRLGTTVKVGKIPKSQWYWEMAEAKAKQIRDGEIVVTVEGSNLKSTGLATVEDPMYENRTDPKEFFNQTELDSHL